ncbi:unnamed protein product [Sphagnum jensenii]
MMFNPEDQDDSDADHDADEEPAFDSVVEINALLLRHRQVAAKAKGRALSLFKHVESEDDAAIYSYSVTIPKTKTTLFRLAVRYMSCGTSFRKAFELIGCTYDVLGNPGLRACSHDEISNFVQGLTTLVLQQQNALDNLIASFIDNVGVIGPLIAESIANMDPLTHVISGRYAVALSSVREFIVGLASRANTLLNEADESDQNDL